MKAWIDLADLYLHDVEGCSITVTSRALRLAAQEFCATSKIWRRPLAPISTLTATNVYQVPLLAGSELVKLESAKLGGKDIEPLLHEHIDTAACGVIMLNQREIWLQPVPAAGTQLLLVAVLQPASEATGLDDVIAAKYGSHIAEGAKALLYGASNKPYSDPAAASVARAVFDDKIRRAIGEAARAYSSAPLRTRPSFM